MPLIVDIDHLCLGEGEDFQGHYMYLLDAETGRRMYEFRAGARYVYHDDYLEVKNMAADGYGPTLLLLLMQHARRCGLQGVAPDSERNSEEALAMIKQFYSGSPSEVKHTRNKNSAHRCLPLDQIYFIETEVVRESRARSRFRRHLGDGMLGRLKLWWVRQRSPMRAALWHRRDDLVNVLRRDYLCRSDEVFRSNPNNAMESTR